MTGYRVIINGNYVGEMDTSLVNTRLTGVTEENFGCFEVSQRYILLKDGTMLETVSEITCDFDEEAKTLTYNGPIRVETNWVYKPSVGTK